jgi:RNA polymerase sigma factor (sigma-70 family)
MAHQAGQRPSREEEMQAESSQRGRKLTADGQARATGYIELADRLASRYHRCRGRRVPLDELTAEAHYALAYASSLFDPTRGVPFGAYVTMVIQHRLIQAEIAWRWGHYPGHVSFTDLTVRSDPVAPPGFDPACPHTRDACHEAGVQELLDCVRRTLPARWFMLLEMRYAQDYTLQEMSARLGVSRERVRQLLVKAVSRARTVLLQLTGGR